MDIATVDLDSLPLPAPPPLPFFSVPFFVLVSGRPTTALFISRHVPTILGDCRCLIRGVGERLERLDRRRE
jgi:hypothetical protein